MSTNSYWQRFSKRALARRRVLAGSVYLGAGAAGLALLGCGGSDDGTNEDATGLLSKPVDTTSKAKPGGTYKSAISSEPPSFDALGAPILANLSYAAFYAYPRLFKWVASKTPEPPSGDVEGDLVDSYEYSGDKLQLTLRLRKGLKWDSRAPTSSREIDAEDVRYSAEKFSKVHNQRGDLFAITPEAAGPIESVSVLDKHSLAFKLKRPDPSLLPALASAPLLFIMPREAEGGFDARSQVRGYGPWELESYQQSSSIVWRKNPEYHVKGRPFFDKIERFTLPEYATRLSQFKAGNIFTSDVRQEDVLATKSDVPDLVLMQNPQYTPFARVFLLGYEPGSPFLDERVRQAFMLLIDRPQITDLFTNREKYQAAGLDVPVRYDTSVGAGEPYWVDPQNEKEFGPNAKYFKLDIAEAKKLLSAAGHANGFETDFHHPTDQGGADFMNHVSLVQDMLREGGIRTALKGHIYATDFIPNLFYAYAVGNYARTGEGRSGIMNWSASARGTAGASLYYHYHKNGTRFWGTGVAGARPDQGDPFVNNLLEKMVVEFDKQKEWAMAKEVQQYLAAKAYAPPSVGPAPNALAFRLHWPVIGNYGTSLTTNSANANQVVETDLNYWLDESKAPLGRS